MFDLDGVLIDSELEYTRIWGEIESQFPTGIENFAEKIKGQTLKKILDDNFKKKDREEIILLLHKKEKEMTYKYCPGAKEFLTELRKEGVPAAVVTSSDDIKMAHLYRDLPEFRSGIDIIIDATRVKKSKPDPEGYLLAAATLGVEISNCVVFEDSIQGVRAGNASGAYVVGIAGTKKREELEPFSDLVVDSIEELNIEMLVNEIERRHEQ